MVARLLPVLVGVFCSAPLVGQGADPLSAEELAWLADHPIVRVGPDPDYPPTEFIDDRVVYSGITADYLRLIERRLGIDFQIVTPTHDERLRRVPDAMGVDVVPISARTPTREKHWSFTEPFLHFPAKILGTFANGPLSMGDLVDRRVAIVEGYAAAEYVASSHPGVVIVPVRDSVDGLQRVAMGDCLAMISDLPVASWFAEREGISNVFVAGESGFTYDMGISVRKDWDVLLGILEKGLATISEDERQVIYRRWVHVSVLQAPPSGAWTYLLGALAVALAGGAGVVMWNRSLKSLIADRTRQLEEEFLARDRAREREQMMVRELDHRVKNTLATVVAISRQTARGASTLGQYTETFEGRIGSLSRIHERLSQRRWRGLQIRELAESMLQPYGPAERMQVAGEELVLPPSCAMPLAMALHELGTNAAKHGSLSTSEGSVHVSWQRIERDGEPWVRLEWIERDGPPVIEPRRIGFGTSLIRNGARYELGGETSLEFAPKGVRCRITFPLEGARSSDATRPLDESATGSGTISR
ncbi:MAG: transporter substrate-binding domain-containing protein [bacterium]|nr:transporter substrate-binding domain-containing protein [bacterium]